MPALSFIASASFSATPLQAVVGHFKPVNQAFMGYVSKSLAVVRDSAALNGG